MRRRQVAMRRGLTIAGGGTERATQIRAHLVGGRQNNKGEEKTMKPVKVNYRARLTNLDMSDMEATENFSWLSRTQRGRIYTVRGVPSSVLTILIIDNSDDIPDNYVRVIELGRKKMKYGGTRSHVTVRYVPPHQAPTVCVAAYVDIKDSTATVYIGDKVYAFGRYQHTLDVNNNLGKIVRWHYSRYYKMLAEHDIVCTENDFRNQIIAGKYTLAEANRLASRLLYRTARDAGYRKLTNREQSRLGLKGQWHSEAEYSSAQQKYQGRYSATGAGEYTLVSARSG